MFFGITSTANYALRACPPSPPAPGSDRHLRVSIRQIERALERRTQPPAEKVSEIDRTYLPALVAMANREKPGLNAHTVHLTTSGGPDWPQFKTFLENWRSEGTESARFIITGDDPRHNMAGELRRIGDTISLILIEPASNGEAGPSLLQFRLYCDVRKEPDIVFAAIDSDLQRSPSGCGNFSFYLIRKIFKEREHFQTLHERNVAGTLPLDEWKIAKGADADALLPPSILKHAQSSARADAYLENRPEMVMQPVTRRAETLMARHARSRILGTDEDGSPLSYNRANEERRRDYLRRLLDARSQHSPGGSAQ